MPITFYSRNCKIVSGCGVPALAGRNAQFPNQNYLVNFPSSRQTSTSGAMNPIHPDPQSSQVVADLQRRIQQQADELQKANQELESFIHSVSHDLRAPLRSIGGFSNILLKDFAPQLPDEARRLVNIVVSSAAQMSQMLDGLLDLSRIGRQSLSIEPIDLASLAKQTLDALRNPNRRPLEAKIGNLPDCLGDPVLLKQLFTNLLSNAFKFGARTNNLIVEIGAHPGNREHTYFIRDNGIGFDMQYAQRLFGAFVRLHSDEEFEGHGVGLAIAQRIIQRHGGRIWAEAEANKGATFFFTLPAAT
jgi:light-regulated signal transduction histidine kinase (bacteriophytochrome)